jgi:RHS repeat-associated protein
MRAGSWSGASKAVTLSARYAIGAGLLVVLVAVLALVLAPASAFAEPLCTDTWTGPSEGNWETAVDWSSGVPTSSTVACIGSGKTVKLTEGAHPVGVLEATGGVWVYYATLEVDDSMEPSRVGALTLQGATVKGGESLGIAESLSWESGTVSGGTLLIELGASANITNSVSISHEKLVNEGTVTLASGSSGTISLSEGAEIENAATFNANSYVAGFAIGGATTERFVNTGTFQTSLTSLHRVSLGLGFDNQGTVNAKGGEFKFYHSVESKGANKWMSEGGAINFFEGTFAFHEGEWDGAIVFEEATATVETVVATAAQVTVTFATLTIPSGVVPVESLALVSSYSVLDGSGSIAVTKFLNWSYAKLTGAGSLIVSHAATGTISGYEEIAESYSLVNEGSINFEGGGGGSYASIGFSGNGKIENGGTFTTTGSGGFSGPYVPGDGIVNTGRFVTTHPEDTTYVQAPFRNEGEIEEVGTSRFRFYDAEYAEPSSEWGGEEDNPSAPQRELPECGDSVSCKGNFSQNQTDFAIGGRGVGLDLTRTYNSQAAAAGKHGPFGYGWTSSFSDHLVLEPTSHLATLVQADGSTVAFTEGSGEAFTAPPWTQDILSGSSSSGYRLTLEDQTVYRFSGTGRLESVTDRNANATTLAYNGSGELESITDPAGRKIKLAYNSEGLVESTEDPMKHVVKYTYEGGNLMTVTQPGEAGLRWQFKYGEAHQLTEMTDGRGGKTINKYNESHQEIEQVDPMSRATTFEYQPFWTKTTSVATGAVTMQYLESSGLGSAVTRGYGTSLATTERSTYNAGGELLTQTDGNGHKTEYAYEGGNRIKAVDPDGDETKWTYDSSHDIHTMTTPGGETTTTERNSDGDPVTISRPAPGSTTQVTKYTYDSHGDETAMEDPLKRVWKYEYDEYGDRKAEIDPEGDKRTWAYNADSQQVTMVSPRGHVSGAKEASFTTTTERDAQGRPVKVIAPLKHETTYKYDGDGNLESDTDAEGNTTTYTYNADNEQIKAEQPNKDATKTEYDGAGQVTSLTDGNEHTTKYKRNILEQVVEIVDPLGRKTLKEYDNAGNLTKVTDAEARVTTYKYDAANRLVEVTYSDGKTPDVKYEYNKDGDPTKMEDGTGTTTYEYDELDRLTSTKDGHGDTVGYEYDLANEQTKITYPSGKAITRAYDNAGRLKSATDWLEHTTKFGYDADSNLASTAFPTGTSDEDTYAYNEADSMNEVKMSKGSETLASITYTRDKDENITKATTKGLPGEEKPAFSYDENSRITKGAGTKYGYDAANNPTIIGSNTYSYNAADELEKAVAKKATVDTYTYNEVGERTRTEPTTGAATAYGYDQAGNLISVARAKSGETPAIEDTYAYNGEALRTSQTVSGTTSYLAWDTAEKLALILSDGTNSYIYGPGGLPFEQISSSGTVLYLHHDQQGSTRMLTGATGSVAGTATYDAYGNETGSTGTSTTPMGYDGQYTSVDTGLIYLRAREYDPATAQFLSVDPDIETTGASYEYASDEPIRESDPTGLEAASAAEIEFSRAYERTQEAAIAELKRKHASAETIQEESRLATYYYYAIEAEIAAGELHTERARNDQEAYQREYAAVAGGVARELAPLIKAESVSGWEGAASSFRQLLQRLYRIKIVLREARVGAG